MKTKALHAPNLFINRELSQLDFIVRVLALAQNKQIPLLERLRFLCITSFILDEFFEVRVARIKEMLALDSQHVDADGLTPQLCFESINLTAHELVHEIYSLYNKELIPALRKEKILFIAPKQWSRIVKTWIKQYFLSEILPVLSPIALDLAHPFPRLVNKSLNFLVALKGEDAFGRQNELAIVHVPRSLPRVIKIPKDKQQTRGDHFILLTSVIEAYIGELFPGMPISGCYQFRLTRNSDLYVDEETEDLAHAVKTELITRHYGRVVRLEISSECPKELTAFLLAKHHLHQDDLYHCDGPVNLSRYLLVLELLDREDLRYPAFPKNLPKRLQNQRDIFQILRQNDILLHHPYQTFSVVVNFIRQAALDPQVLAIKQTLYRTHHESTMVLALIEAAKAGKAVTAVIELRARFDEASNLRLANRLQEAGALVVYGVFGFKTHAKLTLVVRRENNRLSHYAHLGTGNYHERTAKHYVDIGLLTYDASITNDVQQVFQQLTGVSKYIELNKLIASPFNLFASLKKLIKYEIRQAKKGLNSTIIIKVNGITDPEVIRLLYKASQAGVDINLLVRGQCCLRPGVKGISENIQVRSIVGRFLEHARVFYFYHAGKEKIYCSSADLMERNLYHRVEITFPILDPHLAARVKQEALIYYLEDNQESWLLQSDGKYKKVAITNDKIKIAQQRLINKLSKQ